MNKTMTRKVILLSLIGVFLCIYILQLVFTGKSKIQNMTLDATPDAMLVVKGSDTANASNSIRFAYENSTWVVGEKKYPADSTAAVKMAESLKSIKLLGVITRNPGAAAEKYGLDGSSKLVVTAFKDGKSVRTVTVGKDTTSGGQSYVQIDGKDTVYLADGALHSTFGIDLDGARSKEVYTVNADEISSVRVQKQKGAFTVQKIVPKADLAAATKKDDAGKAEAPAPVQKKWELSQNAVDSGKEADDEKIDSWVKSLASLKVNSWAADSAAVPFGEPEATVTVVANGKEYTVKVYKTSDQDTFICSSSSTPYLFNVSNYVAEKYTKSLADIEK